MKKILLLFLLLLMITSCSKPLEYGENYNLETDYSLHFNNMVLNTNMTETGDGIFFVEENQQLYFTSNDNKSVHIRSLGLCGGTEMDGLEVCTAADGERYVSGLSYFNGKLYYLANVFSPKGSQKVVYSISLSGDNLKKEYIFENDLDHIKIHRGFIYFQETQEPEILYRVPIGKKEKEIFFEEEEFAFSSLSFNLDKVFLLSNDISSDSNTSEYTISLDGEIIDKKPTFGLVAKGIEYDISSFNHGTLEAHDIEVFLVNGEHEETISRGPEYKIYALDSDSFLEIKVENFNLKKYNLSLEVVSDILIESEMDNILMFPISFVGYKNNKVYFNAIEKDNHSIHRVVYIDLSVENPTIEYLVD